jgi:selenide,water dikinase
LLDKALKNVNFPSSSDVLVDTSQADDAGIIRINEKFALVQTTDFFTPVVDDPYLFGQIAATNALSDIYAMGAEPISALNILCFPDTQLDAEGFRLIVQGGADKVKEAGAVILGGHSISDRELKYGLALTGKIDPENIVINRNLQAGDKIILTKPIGTGILTTALKNDILNEQDIPDVITSMLTLNKEPTELFNRYHVSACTDVTGFGLLGHLWEMMTDLDVGVNVYIDEIPYFEQAISFAREANQIPGGTLANQRFIEDKLVMGKVDTWYQNILFDPQTSGGLLISLGKESVQSFLRDLENYALPVAVIGDVVEGENKIFLQ